MAYNNVFIPYFSFAAFELKFLFQFSNEACNTTIEELYEDVNERFFIFKRRFLMSRFSYCWQKWFVDVILYSP